MEEHKWPLLDYFYGNNLNFVLNNHKDFSVQQVFHLRETIELPIVISRASTYYDYIGFYGQAKDGIQVYIQKQKFTPLCYIETKAQCFDILIVNPEEVFISCSNDGQNIFYHCLKDVVQEFQDEYNDNIQDIRLESYYDTNMHIIRGVLGSNIITFWDWKDGKLTARPELRIDETKLNLLIDKQFIFNLRDIQVNSQSLFILDAYQGVIEMTMDSSWQFDYQFQISDQVQYMTFTINNHIFMTTDQNQLIIVNRQNTDYLVMYLENIFDAYKILISNDQKQMICLKSDGLVNFIFKTNQWVLNTLRIDKKDVIALITSSELIIFKELQQMRYCISKGYLILIPPTSEVSSGTLGVNAINVDCHTYIPFFYKVFDYMNNDIYVNNLLKIRNIQYYPSQNSIPDCPVTGGNLQESIKIYGRNVASIKTYFTKEILAQNSKATFVRIINTNDCIYYLTQSNNLQTQFYKCDPDTMICYLSLTESITPLYSYNFQWIFNSEVFIAIYNPVDQITRIYSFQGSQLTYLYFIFSKESVIRIKMDQQYLFMIHKNNIIQYQFSSSGVIKKLVIDQNNISKNQELLPQDIMLINSVYYAVITNSQVYFFWIDREAILINKIEFENLKYLKAVVLSDIITVIYSKGYVPIMESYDISNLYYIKRQNIINLNAYKIQTPIQIYAMNKYRFMLRVAHPSLKTSQFIVIDVKALLRDQLITLIDTGVYFNDGDLITIDSTQINQDVLVIFSTETIVKIVNVFQFVQREISVNPEYKQVFLTRVTMQYEYSNIDTAVTVQSYDQVVLLNQFTNLWRNVKSVDQFMQSNDISTFINIKDDWFSGQILNYSIICSSCGNDVTVRQSLQQLHKLELNQSLLSTCKYSDSVQLILSGRNLLFFDAQGFQYRDQLTLEGGQKLICELNNPNFIIQGLTSYMLLKCNSELSKCILYQNPQQQIYTGMVSIIDNYLMIVNEEEIYFLKFEIMGEQFKFIENPYKLKAKDFALPYIYSISNILFPIEGGYRVLILGYIQGILHFDCVINEYLVPITHELIPLQALLIAESIEQLMLQNTNYLNIVSMEGDNFIIATNNVHFAITITFKNNYFKGLKIISLLARYGEIYSTLDMEYSNGYVAMLYDEYPIYKMVVYKLQIYDDIDYIKDNPILINGGISTNATTWNFMYFSYFNELYLYYTDTGLVKCKINTQPQIIIRNSHQFKDSYIKLMANNNKTAPVGIVINLNTEYQSSNKIFVWIVSAMLAILIIIVILFFGKRIKKKAITFNIQEE